MRRIVHLSDLHFGKIDERNIAPLLLRIKHIHPELVVISGDLTQRGTKREFQKARDFIISLALPVLAVPGNHDVPYYDVWNRLCSPYGRFTQFITPITSDRYTDEEIVIVGLNSVRQLSFWGGRIAERELARVEDIIKDVPTDGIRIVFMHHPLALPSAKEWHSDPFHNVVSGSERAMQRLANAHVDIFLTGHLHVFSIANTTEHYKIENYAGLIVQAGTALSSRLRGETSSFNVITTEKQLITVENYRRNVEIDDFTLVSAMTFDKGEQGWKSA